MANNFELPDQEQDTDALNWGQESPDVFDFSPETQEESPSDKFGEANVKNTAAFKALHTEQPTQVVPEYLQQKKELEKGNAQGVHDTESRIKLKYDQNLVSDAYDILGNKDLPVEDRMSVVNKRKGHFPSMRENLGDTWLEQGIEDNDSPKDHNNRLELYAYADSVRAKQTELAKQVKLTRNAIEKETSTSGKVIDFGALMLPFVQNNDFKKYVDILKDGGALRPDEKNDILHLLGEREKEYSNAVGRMTPDKQIEHVKALRTLLSQAGVLDSGNSFVLQDMLTMVQEGLEPTQRVMDNGNDIVSLAGVAKLGGEVVKGLKATSEATRAAKVGEAFGGVKVGGTEVAEDALKADGGVTVATGTEPTKVVGNEVSVTGEVARKKVATGEEIPTSVLATAQQNNPRIARNMYEVAAKDSEEAANAVTGVSQLESATSPRLPEIVRDDGLVSRKTPDIGSRVKDETALSNPFEKRSGASYFTVREKEGYLSSIRSDFDNVNYKLWNASTQVGRVDVGGVEHYNVRSVYGGRNTGLRGTNQEVVDKVYSSLKGLGVDKSSLKAYVAEGDTFAEAPDDVKDIEKTVVLDQNFKYNISSVVDQIANEGFPERIGSPLGRVITTVESLLPANARAGTYLLPPEFMFNVDSVARPLSIAVDKTEKMNKIFGIQVQGLASSMGKLDKDALASVGEYMKEATEKNWNLSDIDTTAKGFGEEAREVIRKWHKTWEDSFSLRNQQKIDDLNNLGIKMIQSTSNDDSTVRLYGDVIDDGIDVLNLNELLGKGGKTKTVANLVKGKGVPRLYTIGNSTSFDIYKTMLGQNGVLVKPVSKIMVDGRPADYVIVNRNWVQDSIPDGKIITKYQLGRAGYTKGGNPTFITRDGEAIGAIDDVTEARKWADELNSLHVQEQSDFEKLLRSKRQDKADGPYAAVVHKNADEIRRSQVQMEQNTGSLDVIIDGDELSSVDTVRLDKLRRSYHPLSLLQQEVNSVAQIAGMNDTLNLMKTKFMAMYGHLVNNASIKGKNYFPVSKSEISEGDKLTGEAKGFWDYISHQEHQISNGSSVGYKYLANTMADILEASLTKDGKKEFLDEVKTTAGKVARFAGKKRPADFARGLAFRLQVAGSPLRQGVLAAFEMIKNLQVAPVYMAKGQMIKDFSAILLHMQGSKKLAAKVAGRSQSDMNALAKQWVETGTGSATNATYLQHAGIRGEALKDVAAQLQDSGSSVLGAAKLAVKITASPIVVTNKVLMKNFELLEEGIQLASWLAQREHFITKKGISGEKLTQAHQEEISGETRLFTTNLGKAGEIPFQSDVISMFTPYANAVLHQLGVASGFGLKRPKTMIKFAGAYALLFGLPESWVEDVGADPDDGALGEAVSRGMFGFCLNSLFRLFDEGEEKARVSMAKLDPYELGNPLIDFVSTLWADGGSKAIEKSIPKGIQSNVVNFLSDAGKVIFDQDDYADTKDKLVATASLAANLYSGYSAYSRYKIAERTGLLVSSKTGAAYDFDVTHGEAVAQLFGLTTQDQEAYFKINNDKFAREQNIKEGVDELWAQYSRFKSEVDGYTQDQVESYEGAFAMAWSAYSDDPYARNYLAGLIRKSVADGDPIGNSIRKAMPLLPKKDLEALVDQMPASPKKDQLRNMLKYKK